MFVQPWYNPVCPDSPFSDETWDLTPCFQAAVVQLAPPLLLAIVGGLAFPRLLARFKNGERPETGGKQAYIVKLGAAAALIIAQVAYLACVALEGKNFWNDVRFPSGVLVLVAFIFAFTLHAVSHPLTAHSSTPLLFFELFSILTLAISLRTSLSAGPVSTLPPLELGLFVLLIAKLALFITLFSIELLGPEGWDGLTWRSWFSWVPGVAQDGAIRLEEGDGEEWDQKECPRLRANIFQRLTFSWLTPLMKAGSTKFLTEEDLWALPPDDTAEALGSRLEANWTKRREAVRAHAKAFPDAKKTRPSLTGALVASFGGPFFTAAIFKLLQDCLSFSQPQLLRRLLLFVGTYRSDAPEPAFHGYLIALTMFGCAMTQTLLLHCYFARVFETGMRVRAGLISLIYKKSLVLSNDERGGRLTGDIVNLQSTDSTRLQDLCTYGQVAWSGMFQITLAFISLYQLLGWTMLVGVGVMIASMPLTAAIAKYQTKLQREQMKNKDQRTSIMSEILNNIRSIKLYAWEDSFAAKLFDVRNNKELVMLRKMGYLSSSSNFLWSFTPFAVAFSSFALFSTISGKPLTSDIVFPAITLFSLLSFPLAVLPVVFASLVEAYVSVDRLTEFLCGKELQEGAVTIEIPERELKDGDELVSVVQGEFSWTSTSLEPTLVDINLSLKKGELLAVVGRVGSGKSSLLSAVLGEMTKTEGSVTVRGTVAFCNQQPWIVGGTVRQNITFGYEYDPEFYQIVLAACALKEDLAILPSGDQTEVGEKGISLSGGQKARVALARAVYSRADIYLLDDPLSAVDAHVGRHLFDQVLGPHGLLAGKARLLCTNAIPFCEQADELIFLRKGVIIERGTFSSAVTGDTELSRLLLEFGRKDQDIDDDAGGSSSDETVVVAEALDAKLVQEDLSIQLRQKASVALMQRAKIVPVDVQKRQTLRELKASTRPKEKREHGSVKVGVYKQFIKANSYLGVSLYMFTIVLQQGLQIGTNVWLKNWAGHNQESGNNGNLAWYLGIYAAFGLGASFTFLINGLLLYSLCVIRAAKVMHDGMFHAVMRSPMLFFETTPLGTILNRFSRDIYVIDEVLARVFGGFFRTMAGVFGMVAVICASAPEFMFVAVPLFFVYRQIQAYYLSTSRELKRLDSTTKSPIFASFQETLGGVATIRAYGQTERFVAENEARIDRNQEAYFPSINCNRWLAVRLEFLGSIIILSTATLAVYTVVRTNTLDAGMVGLMLSYALSTTQTLNWVVRSATEVETNIVSVERVQEYMDLKPEAPLYIPATEPAADWPQEGSLTYSHVSARYRKDLDLVLRDVSFYLKGGQSIGVCGRTGAGKSSLTMLLYRVIEAETGTVFIDGVDISKIGLHCLRSRLSVIPQDSQCFEGTLRENLDPTCKTTDAELWRALEQCRLKDHIESMDGKLDAHIDEGGSNLSAGQRQLMCLGRALLRHSKILVLDEATAAVDPESDKEIQTVIRREFSTCTIFVIAHRLNTILDCDKILVMDAGRVAEFDSPTELLAKKDSIFYSLASEAGLVYGSGRGVMRPPKDVTKAGEGTSSFPLLSVLGLWDYVEIGASERGRRRQLLPSAMTPSVACLSRLVRSSRPQHLPHPTPRRATLTRPLGWRVNELSLGRVARVAHSLPGGCRGFSSSRGCGDVVSKSKDIPDLSQFPPSKIRNLAIMAHIDHGKSTLADRLLELTGTIPPVQINRDRNEEDTLNEQILDTLKVERERGITVRAQSASMFYTDPLGETWLINLVDTPGHADFSSELLRSLLPSQGALLLVDAAQGIQAQTLSVLDEAKKHGLKIVGAVNKWDLVEHDGRGPAAVTELADLISCEEDDILRVSAKTGLGVETVLEAIVSQIPPPAEVLPSENLRALVFDNWYDTFRGVVSLLAVVEGEIRKGDAITSTTTGLSYQVVDLGIMSPKEIPISSHPIPASRVLRKGMVGWITCGMKEVKDAFLGDTFHHTHSPMPPLESFKPLKSMVFAGIYPLEPGGFPKLEEAVRRLTLTDRSVTSNRESSSFLGQGFRLGFNGSLHMDVFRQRLEDEFDEEVIVTRPLVPVKLVYKNGTERTIDNPADFPDPAELLKVDKIMEPMIRATIVAPDEFTGAIINLCTSHRGVPISHTYLSAKTSSSAARITLLYSLPLSSIVTNFHSTLKSITSGFASFDYEEAPYEVSELCRLNILVNTVKVDALCSVIHRSLVQKEGREWARRLREVVPKQQFEVIIQAAVGSEIIARERVAPVRKDVTAGLYGGDYTRKMKHLAKQRAGKKRLKERSIGNVTIPTSAFFTVLGGQEGKRKAS